MTKEEKSQYRRNVTIGNPKEAPVKPGEELVVNIRGRVVEVGSELSVVDLTELREQHRVKDAILVYVPNDAIRKTRINPEKLPPQVPE